MGQTCKNEPLFSVGKRLTVQGDEMKLTVLVPALAGLLWAGSALADAQLEVTNPYVVQLIDYWHKLIPYLKMPIRSWQ